jgi:cell division protease FtsH
MPSAETQQIVDQEVRRIVEESFAEVLDLLRSNRDKLEKLALALLDQETLDQADAYAIAGIDPHLSDDRLRGGLATPA